MTRILFAGCSSDLAFLGAYIDELEEAGYEVVTESHILSVEKILVAEEVDLAIIYGGPLETTPPVPEWYVATHWGRTRAGFLAVRAARNQGITTPAIFVVTVFGFPPSQDVEDVAIQNIDDVITISAADFLPSSLLRVIREMLGGEQ
jgi:hypothetical protein